MKISPLDIQQQQFKGKLIGGLDAEDVDAFLQQVSAEMEDLIRENTELKEQTRRFTADNESLREKEIDLRETMLAAQRVTEEMKINAQKEVTLLISEAELKADRILDDANRKLSDLKSQIQDLRNQKMQFQTSLKSLLETHGKLISMNDE